MIDLLITLIVWLVVGGLVYWLITLLPLPAPIPTIIRVAVIVILILLILGLFTGWTPVYRVR
jgi:cation transporter-like permease